MANRSAYCMARRSCPLKLAPSSCDADVTVEIFGQPLCLDGVSSKGQADGAIIELGDAHTALLRERAPGGCSCCRRCPPAD